MTVYDAYEQFLKLVNKNNINDNVGVSKYNFITLFNSSQNKFVDSVLERLNQKDRRLIQRLLETDKKLSNKKAGERQTTVDLPKDYFEFVNIDAYATNDSCKKQRMLMVEVKSENINHLLADSNSKPSFKYREGIYVIAQSKVILYKDDFEYSDVYLDYYRKPVQIDIDGYVKADGKPSTNIDPEFEDREINRILLIAAKDFNLNNENLEKFQADNTRIISKF